MEVGGEKIAVSQSEHDNLREMDLLRWKVKGIQDDCKIDTKNADLR